VEALFGPALAAQPARAATFTLYFVEGKDELTAESQEVVGKILSEIAKRRVPDIVVVGHTDLVGSHPFNDALGQQRADAVRSALIRLGIPAEDVRAISRGKREPAVPTADGVAEPRNRRVVILVR
jgi:outer membrane protein OmpA-like peptidoglycan-associated protein